ncbi:MAG: hypothetical protein KF845_07520 [Cyclobacteriaceae bacterium]|nr:hypothetical protein [Cyclobacteriaceae bacterium]
MIDAGLYLMYVLFIVAVVAAVVLPLISAIKSPSTFLKSLYSVIALVVVFGISYALSGSDVTTIQAAKGLTPSVSKLVGAGLTMFYLVMAIAIIGLIYSEINKAFK